MQPILQWLLKRAHEQERESNYSLSTGKDAINDSNAKGKDITLQKHHKGHQRIRRIEASLCGCKNLRIFAFICRKDIPKTCFYNTLNLRSPRSVNRKQYFVYPVKMKTEEITRGVGINNNKADSAAHAGNRVLPITEASFSTSTDRTDQSGTSENKDQTKGEKKKPISKMKDLIRWAAAAKSEKAGKFNGRKVLQFRRRGTLKAVPFDDQVSSDSPKISFRWDVESCSTTSSVYSAISMASSAIIGQTQITPSSVSNPSEETDHTTSRKGNWITTDSEFVVLEL